MAATRTIKPLNEPQPVEVRVGPGGEPLQLRIKTTMSETATGSSRPRSRRSQNHQFSAIRSDGKWMSVIAIEDYWKINDEWWRGEELEIERLYFDVVIENNQRITIFHDLVRNTWSRQAE